MLVNVFILSMTLKLKKKRYENETFSILTIDHSTKINGDDPNNLIYKRVKYVCKAGNIRPTQSKGIRQPHTGKLNCPVMLRLSRKNDILNVVEFNSLLINHNCDQQTYQHYVENMRLSAQEKEVAGRVIKCGGNKQVLKMQLMSERENSSPVPVKSLHNFQTKIFASDDKEGNELKNILVEMQKSTGT